ncbi:DUF1800 domain-containing protein [Roseateles sp. BYS96W]|uniref:DUF1800 family protein n=1 Tax=Pelomonas nitida TaxID=3299027 RepID=A0ABW7G1N1_9BURK
MGPRISHLAAMLCFAALTGCGGGGKDAGATNAASASGTESGAPPGSTAKVHTVATPEEASRFLAQATFGPNEASITALKGRTIESWLDAEFAKPQRLHADTTNALFAAAGKQVENDFYGSWWTQAITGDDQLRQRVAFALSQIMVVSFDLNALRSQVAGISGYYDVLGRNAFGNFRTLLEDVTLNPAMGTWLAMLKNQKENDSTGRTADENYAREVMQLFTIGLHKLNADGSIVTSNGDPVETYTNADVTGLAKALTGWSWGGPDKTANRFFGRNGVLASNRWQIPMQSYDAYHSTATKTFLGVTTAGDAQTDLKVALDTLFNHPNVGPFIGKQLIQRLVTSNPSPAYVARVTGSFNNNGAGVRGDMKAVIRAILLDDEARDVGAAYSQQASFGRIREPVLRLANWMRSFEAVAPTGFYNFGATDGSLGMTPMNSPSVFNFYRPGYVAPASKTGAAGLVAPELQITHETSVAQYLNVIDDIVSNRLGNNGNRIAAAYGAERALADTPAALVDRVILLLNAGVMPATKRQAIVDAVTAIAIPTTNADKAAAARNNRVCLAVYLVLGSADYIVQK